MSIECPKCKEIVEALPIHTCKEYCVDLTGEYVADCNLLLAKIGELQKQIKELRHTINSISHIE